MNKWLAYGLLGVGAYLLLKKTGVIKGFAGFDDPFRMGGYPDTFNMGELGWMPGTVPFSSSDWKEVIDSGAAPSGWNPHPTFWALPPDTDSATRVQITNAWLDWERANNPYFKPGAPNPPKWPLTSPSVPSYGGGGGGVSTPPPNYGTETPLTPKQQAAQAKRQAQEAKKAAALQAKKQKLCAKSLVNKGCWKKNIFGSPINKCCPDIEWSQVQTKVPFTAAQVR